MTIDKSWITKEMLESVGDRDHHGINIPLSAIRTENSSGIGEFYDLLPLIEWCQRVGFDVIQLLPLNDTGKETSPYNALTSCGLNPIFLSLHALPHMQKNSQLKSSLNNFNKFKRLCRVPYESVLHEKMAFLRLYFQTTFRLYNKTTEYQEFVHANDWLYPYALFKVLKDQFVHEDWERWPNELKNPSKTLLKSLYREEQFAISFYIFLQYLCYMQLKKVKEFANEHNVLIKGDVPILISPQSADVWIYKADFDTNFSVGAPPDQFTAEGQNWGFPLYNWDVIKADGFRWWRKRLKFAENFFNIYRLDHIIGFFRIWTIPKDKKATDGYYVPGEPWAAEHQGKSILQALVPYTQMLPIGEDLGKEVEKIQEIMQSMGIFGTRVIRWMRNHLTDNSFIPYQDYPHLSMTTVSTHDSETLTLWWQQYPKEAQEFCEFRGLKYEETLSKELRHAILHDSHTTPSLFHINLLNEYLAMFDNLVWENPEDERINIPGTVQPRNWTYRLRPSIEEIVSHQDLASMVKNLLKAA